ncbi:uncharacterized protein GGS22DRAFT_192760 [Annulohypoxylon maeteangense]|uniref:uncharacterized protein n=1 Tax=Annulohypoxylon maeteangense TaxID=1927788 RepID=UPI0020089EE6|nr:uncharacterized protein GGS22DRAFT_192760 [Annulohypoxylon maeteangense]KAI0880923.1 hypothetical protein GGS22DRAFT_192760 [Annulohypoxylon maeteangense]
MAAHPSWSIFNFRLKNGTNQKVIFVFHGDVDDRTRFTPASLPICLHLGNGERTWRGDHRPYLRGSNADEWVDRAVRARNTIREPDDPYDPDFDPDFLRVPEVQEGVEPAPPRWPIVFLQQKKQRVIRWIQRDSVYNSLYALTRNMVIMTLVLTAIFLVSVNPNTPQTTGPKRVKINEGPISIITQYVPFISHEDSEVPLTGENPMVTQNDAGLITAAPIQSDSGPFTAVQTMPVPQSLLDLVSQHHGVIYDSWSYMHREFVEDTRFLARRLTVFTAPKMSTSQSKVDESDVLNIMTRLNTIQETLNGQKKIWSQWNGQALTNLVNLATWWSWDDSKFDPERFLLSRIPASDTAVALKSFESTVVPRNARVQKLLDQVVCSGSDGDIPWEGLRAHYAEVGKSFNSARADMREIEVLVQELRGRRTDGGALAMRMDDVLVAVGKAHHVATRGINAAKAMTDGLEAVCLTSEKTAQLGWRLNPRDHEDLVRKFLPQSQSGVRNMLPAFMKTADATELWLSSEISEKAVDDVTEAAWIVWSSDEKPDPKKEPVRRNR